MAEALEIKLPESFFDALKELKEDSGEDTAENNRKFYESNILSNDKPKKVVLDFTAGSISKAYEDVGASIFTGGVKIFFDYWEKIKRQEEYRRVDKIDKKPIAPIINVNLEKDEKPKIPAPGSLGNLALLAILLLGIAAGTGPLGQIIETISYLPRALKDLKSTKWVKSITDKINKVLGGLKSALKAIPNFFTKFGKFGTFIGKSISTLGKIGGSIFSLFGKAGMALLKAKLLPFLKKLPLIGTILSFYQAYLRFKEGNYLQAIMEVAAGILPYFGPLGFAISMGLNVLQSFWDKGTGGGSIAKATLKGITNIGSKLLSKLPAGLLKFLKPLTPALKRIPVLGTLISFGFAIKEFNSGDTTSGILSILSGLASLVPGVGTAIGIAIDTINYFVGNPPGEKENKEEKTSSKSWFTGIKEWFSELPSKVWNAVKNGWNWVTDSISSVTNKAKSIVSSIGNGIKEGFNTLKSNLKNTFPQMYNFLSDTSDKIKGTIKSIGGWVSEHIVGNVKSIISGTKDWISNTYTNIRTKITQSFDRVKSNIKNSFNNALNFMKNIVTKIINVFKAIGNWILDKIITPMIEMTYPIFELSDKYLGTNIVSSTQKQINEFRKKLEVVGKLDDKSLKALQIARTEAFQKFGQDSLNDSSKRYKESMDFINKRKAELEKMSIDEVNNIEKSLAEIPQNEMLNKTNENIKINLDNTKNIQKAQHINLEQALNKTLFQTQGITDNQSNYLKRMVAGIDKLISTVENKPVAFASINAPNVNVTNNNVNSQGFTNGTDPRNSYK